MLQLSIDRELNSFCNLRKGVKKNLNLSCTEVRWHPELQSTIASAATNGTIIIWDLKNTGISRKASDFKCKRAPYSLAWSYIDPNVLLSGSQQSRVQLWDMRTKKAVSVFKHNRSSSVHKVTFQPSISHNRFIAGLENGSIVFWDCRNTSKPEYTWKNAHHGIVTSLTWHPTLKNVLASGGRDKTIKIWQQSVSEPEQKGDPYARIQTTASVGRLRWRPGTDDEIASCSSIFDNDVNLWNIKRPNFPIAVFRGHTGATTGIEWVSNSLNSAQRSEMLVSCSKDGSVLLHAIECARVPLRHMRTGCVRFNTSGGLAFLNQPVRRSQLGEVLFLGNSEALISERPDVSLRIESEDDRTHRFLILASKYRIYGFKSALDACIHNEQVARDVGSYDHASVWRFLAQLHQVAPKSASASEIRDLAELRKRAIVRIAEHAAEHGATQLCAVVLISLDRFQRDHFSQKDWFEPFLSRKRLKQFLAAYIEILQSYRLEVEAAEIRKFGLVEDFAALTQKDTSLRFRCMTCKNAISSSSLKSMDSDRTSCDCSPQRTVCSICNLPANRSVTVWCAMCGHGGHIDHINTWFKNNHHCPVDGCDHECVL